MARLTWKGIKEEAIRELRSRSDISSRAETWLWEGYQEVAYGFRFYELEKTVAFNLSANASEITFTAIGATNIKHILSLRDTTNKRKLTASSFRYIDRHADGSGAPTHYCRFGASLLFDAAPSSSPVSYRLRYRKQVAEPDFSSSSTFPETPAEWDEIIRLYAVARGFDALFEKEMATSKRNTAKEVILGLPTDEFVEAEDQEFGVQVRV